MALSARPTNVPVAPNISSGQSFGGRNVAAVGYARIDELTPKSEINPDFNDNLAGYSDWMNRRRQPEPEPLRNMGGNFDLESTTFLSLLAQEQSDSAVMQPDGMAKRAFQGLLSRAIRAYEGTATVIHHTQAPRGGSLSLNL